MKRYKDNSSTFVSVSISMDTSLYRREVISEFNKASLVSQRSKNQTLEISCLSAAIVKEISLVYTATFVPFQVPYVSRHFIPNVPFVCLSANYRLFIAATSHAITPLDSDEVTS